MSTPQAQPADSSAQVAVTLDGCGKEDAHTVFAALNTAFASDRASDDAPADVDDGRPTIWAATFDVSRKLAPPDPGRLQESVVLTAQGGYRDVDRLRESLAEAFAVQVVGTASGDQEEEVRLRLDNR